MIAAMKHLPSDLCAECWSKIKAAARDEKSRRKAKARPRVEAKAAKREGRNERMRAIRAAVIAETGGVCAACHKAPAHDAHHLLSGGERPARESVLTCAPLCRSCHGQAGHDSADMDTLNNLLAWCRRTNRSEAARALYRRIAKVEEARR